MSMLALPENNINNSRRYMECVFTYVTLLQIPLLAHIME